MEFVPYLRSRCLHKHSKHSSAFPKENGIEWLFKMNCFVKGASTRDSIPLCFGTSEQSLKVRKYRSSGFSDFFCLFPAKLIQTTYVKFA